MITRLVLPYPPSANKLKRIVTTARGAFMAKTGQATEYSKSVGRIATLEKVAMIEGPIAIRMNVYRPIRRGDLDNTIKAVQDSLTGIAFRDDDQIVRIVANRYDDKLNPRVEIWIAPLTQEAPDATRQ